MYLYVCTHCITKNPTLYNYYLASKQTVLACGSSRYFQTRVWVIAS